jgi:hypothetical protein
MPGAIPRAAAAAARPSAGPREEDLMDNDTSTCHGSEDGSGADAAGPAD